MNGLEDHDSYSMENSDITDSSSSEKEVESEEHDQHKPTLSPASISKIMKSATPENCRLSTGAKEFMYECVMKFVEVIFEEAKKQCLEEGDEELTGDHFLQAFENVNLHDYHGFFYVFLQIHQENLNEIANDRTDELQQIGSAEMVLQNNNSVQPDSAVIHPGIHRHLPLPIPSPFLVPPIQIQQQHVPLIRLGAPVPVPPFVRNPPLAMHMNNPIPLLLPQPAQPLPLPMPLQNAIAAASLPFHPYAHNLPWAPPMDQFHLLQQMMRVQPIPMQIQGGLTVRSVTVHHENPILGGQHVQQQVHGLVMHAGDDDDDAASTSSGGSRTDSCGPPDADSPWTGFSGLENGLGYVG